MKTSKEIAEEYIKMFPKVERDNDCLFEFYSGKNGNRIKGKKRVDLNCYMIDDNLNQLFLEYENENIWKKINFNTPKVYLWGSSILIDFNENFYYEIGLEQNTIDFFISNPNKELSINKLNINKDNIEKEYKFDIIIL